MEPTHSTFTLSDSPNGDLCKCHCCNNFLLGYKNIFLTFHCKQQLLSFYDVLYNLNEENFVIDHPSGRKAILKNNHFPGQIGFSKMEVAEILSLIQEGLLINSALHLLGN